MYVWTCILVFLAAYLVNATVITVFYHRGLAHGAVELSPRARAFAAHAGFWLTGLDAKGWVCMHRRHHQYSDTDLDPHSPRRFGLFGLLPGQLRSYERTLIALVRREADYTDGVVDLDFPVSPSILRSQWYLPYLLHLGIALAIAVPGGWWALGASYWLGMMSHPIEGWIVNALGHAVGSRNFDTADDSRNNHLAAWLVFGEGYQNNHHRYPSSAKFSYRRRELDSGYVLCLGLERLGLLSIRRDSLIPASR